MSTENQNPNGENLFTGLMEELIKPYKTMAKQRSILMALVANLLNSTTDEADIIKVRMTIAKTFEIMIDTDNMVGDEIDMRVTDLLHSFLVAQKEINDINEQD